MDVVGEIPVEIKRLVKLVVRGFYPPETGVVIDALIKHQCVQEEALASYLRFDRKQLRQTIAIMRQDKFIQARQRMETGPDGKSQSQSYYYINYKLFVNVVKYKLDFMRRKIETGERETNNRASFKCQGCEKCFTDLEADQLIDFTTGELRCHHCGEPVVDADTEESSAAQQHLLVRFNEQIEPLFGLIREVENVRLAPELLEPQPQEIRLPGQPKKNHGQQNDKPGGWSGDSTRYTAAEVTVGDAAPVAMRETKEIPVWLQKSTVVFDDRESDILFRKSSNPFPAGGSKTMSAEEIMQTLLSHENQDDVESEKKESEEEGDDRCDEVPEEIPVVMVAGEPIAIQDINQDLVEKMSDEEKRYYIAVARRIYAAVYE